MKKTLLISTLILLIYAFKSQPNNFQGYWFGCVAFRIIDKGDTLVNKQLCSIIRVKEDSVSTSKIFKSKKDSILFSPPSKYYFDDSLLIMKPAIFPFKDSLKYKFISKDTLLLINLNDPSKITTLVRKSNKISTLIQKSN